jgi:type II secretory pathway predicted ATPase ExeA
VLVQLQLASRPPSFILAVDRQLAQLLTLFEDASHGIPRRINQICTAALVAGAVAKSKVIDDTPVRQAINDLERE